MRSKATPALSNSQHIYRPYQSLVLWLRPSGRTTDTRACRFENFVPKTAAEHRDLYQAQLQIPGYKAVTERVPIVGTWDDHDFGINNGDRTFPHWCVPL